MFVNHGKEDPAYICCTSLVVRGVEPYHLPGSVFLPSCILLGVPWPVGELVIIPTFNQCFPVNWCCLMENLFICWVGWKPVFNVSWDLFYTAGGWFDFTLMKFGVSFGFLNGLNKPVSNSSKTSKKSVVLILCSTSILNPSLLKIASIFFLSWSALRGVHRVTLWH